MRRRVIGITIFLAAILLASVLVWRDTGSTRDGAGDSAVLNTNSTSTPIPTPPVSPITTPLPSSSPQPWTAMRIPVEWVDVPSPLSGEIEDDVPFAAEGTRYAKEYPGNGDPVWGIYIGSATQPPHQIFASMRFITNVDWQDSGINARFATRKAADDAGLGRILLEWTGTARINVESGQSEEELDALPFAPSHIDGLPPRSFALSLRDAGDALVLARRSTLGGPGLAAVTVIDASGGAAELRGLPQDLVGSILNWRWTTDGRGIFGVSGLPNGSVVFLPRSGGDGLVVRGALTNPLLRRLGPSGQEQMVLLLTTGEHEIADVAILDLESLALTTATRLPFEWNRTLISITDAGNLHLRQENNLTEVDLTTGSTVERALTIGTTPDDRIGRIPSASGLFDISNESPPEGSATRPTAECRGLPYKMSLTDLTSQASRVLLECQGGTSGSVRWLNDTKALVSIAGCWGCDGFTSRMLIVDASTEIIWDLVDFYDQGMLASPSPDGEFILLGGTAIRLLDNEGSLLVDYGSVPDGYSVKRVIWSPDGSQFAFLLGPKMWLESGPEEWWITP